ncbi:MULTISPECIES: hypothetical protein [unclassified Sphingomonas]|uniref:hypothetical protein n=1 Tax=unclassified Sphingomonas TaxID=196159 RepID=UPI0021518006|nr:MULTISPECIES: hypothetical protein [unclassified Sphingomonas]MCR5870290.1 hypothetical protein [Sphingomonas sp. J344]UUX98024.1 hypothetical protein LRS08_10305 [Sphingomonas sp. J315]
MNDAMPVAEPAIARALIVAPVAAQDRHATALAAGGARVLRTVVPDGLEVALESLIVVELILIDGVGLAPDRAAASAERIVDWARGGDCRIVALLDRDALDLAAPVLLDAGAMLLCDPAASDYAAALALATVPPGARLYDATRERETERLRLLNEEVARLAAVLSDFAADPVRRELRERGPSFRAEPSAVPDPDPRTVRATIRARRLRDQHFAPELFADPAWDMLLDLYAARLERGRVSVSSLCIAASVPPTTALRWIGTMHDAGLFEREADPGDRRRAHIMLSARAADAMRGYFAAVARLGLMPA